MLSGTFHTPFDRVPGFAARPGAWRYTRESPTASSVIPTSLITAAEFGHCSPFQRLTLRYVQAQLVQSTQSTGCNAEHRYEQRLARWLLICADRVHGNQFKISQEFLSHMLLEHASYGDASCGTTEEGEADHLRTSRDHDGGSERDREAGVREPRDHQAALG
jgi:hypothetical protein